MLCVKVGLFVWLLFTVRSLRVNLCFCGWLMLDLPCIMWQHVALSAHTFHRQLCSMTLPHQWHLVKRSSGSHHHNLDHGHPSIVADWIPKFKHFPDREKSEICFPCQKNWDKSETYENNVSWKIGKLYLKIGQKGNNKNIFLKNRD